jgi:magnesium-transporting ATPase (P-type)
LCNRYFQLEEDYPHKFEEMSDQPPKAKKPAEPERKSQSGLPRLSLAGGKDHEVELWNFGINEANTHDRRFIRNKIRTTKYTWFTFVPKNLFEQFSKMANVYFLFIMVLQIIPPISITNGQPAILLPLMFVVAVSAVKDLFEDIKRHKADD